MPQDTGARYWNQRYARFLASGSGSVGLARAWKWRTITRYVPEMMDVLDVGCGDLSFWQGRDVANYLGTDISDTVLKLNRQKRPDWQFVRVSAATPLRLKRQVVLCMDLLFHITTDDSYFATLKNLADWTEDFLFVFTWRKNPFRSFRINVLGPAMASGNLHPRVRRVAQGLKAYAAGAGGTPRTTDTLYQTFRPPSVHLDFLAANGLTMEGCHPCPFEGGVGALYVFRQPAHKP